MMKTIAVTNQKGGVGKTTSTLALASAIANKGYNVCLVDLDPQGSLTLSLGLNPDTLEKTVYNILINELTVDEVALKIGNLTILPANIDLSAAEIELLNEIGREGILSDILKTISNRFDFVFIDNPPSLNLLTINSLVAADGVIIPVETKFLGLRGISLLLSTIEKVRKKLNRNLEIVGIIPTMSDNTVMSREVLDELKSNVDNITVYKPVKRTVKVVESSVAYKSIVDFKPSSDIAQAYKNIAEDLLKWQKNQA